MLESLPLAGPAAPALIKFKPPLLRSLLQKLISRGLDCNILLDLLCGLFVPDAFELTALRALN